MVSEVRSPLSQPHREPLHVESKEKMTMASNLLAQSHRRPQPSTRLGRAPLLGMKTGGFLNSKPPWKTTRFSSVGSRMAKGRRMTGHGVADFRLQSARV